MADEALVKAVITFLNEGLAPGCMCTDCVESETAVAEGVIKLVRDHDAVTMEDPLPQPGPAQGYQSVERHDPSMMDGGRNT